MKRAVLPGVGLILASLFTSWPAAGQDTPELGDATATPPRIIGPISDGTPPPPAPPKEPRDHQVLKTTIQSQGGRTITIHRVADPQLPPRPVPVGAAIDLDDPQVQAWLEQQRQEAKRHRLTIISATVFDHETTFLRWWVFGDGAPPEEFCAWSNVDFNHLTGFGTYEVGDIQFGLLMGIGNSDSAGRLRLAQEHGPEFQEPALPALPVSGPAYAITKGDTMNADGLALIEGLHVLYRNEKDRLIAAYEGRERARREREAYLKANPPKPKDITLRYWRKADPKPLLEGGAR